MKKASNLKTSGINLPFNLCSKLIIKKYLKPLLWKEGNLIQRRGIGDSVIFNDYTNFY